MIWTILIRYSQKYSLRQCHNLRAFSQPALAFLGYEEGYEPEDVPAIPPIPKFEEDIPTIYAAPRWSSGKRPSIKLRKHGWTPAVIEPTGERQVKIIRMIPKDCLDLMHTYGYYGAFCTAFKLVVIPRDLLVEKVRLEIKEGKIMQNIPEEETYRVLPRIVHINRCGLFVENISFYNCPREKIVRVPVQVVTIGEEDAPLKKTGNYISQVKFWVNVECRGDQIPPMLEVDVSKFQFGDEVYVKDLESTLPEGVRLWRKETYGEELLIKVGGREKKDASYYQQMIAEREGQKDKGKKGAKRKA
eukprot:TRINITY_DN5706_c0_g6_i1.p1 TRINITY_DN5706_c0_g6~~TRINITY_DN5706_c0_g6_i1.p1  ORF type:complete len:302 (-),score=31.99 TRINITY_DN5706_c0_g6_i1:144-1049(-)